MTKSDLLKNIAQTGYNVGYGAKLHFATYDMAGKGPGAISFLTFGVGLYFLLVDFTAKKYFSAACIILGMVGLRMSMWDHKKEEYAKSGRDLTDIFNKLKSLYYHVKASNDAQLDPFVEQLAVLQKESNGMSLSNQMLFSDWCAHYKFFWQQQIDWMDEQLHFALFRDRLPLTFTAAVSLLVLGGIIVLVLHSL